MKHSWVILVGLSLACAGARGAEPLAPQALWQDVERALTAGQKDKALELLQTVPQASAYHAWALLESARVLYETAQWNTFFGVSIYLRRVYPKAPQTETVRLLEALALIRHCQWRQVDAVLNEAAPSPNQSFLKEVVSLTETVGTETPAEKEKRKSILPASNLWPVSGGDISKLDPYRMRRKIEAKCDLKKEAK